VEAKVYQLFCEKYPDLKFTEQRIAEQKRVIMAKGLLAVAVIEKIKAESIDEPNTQKREGGIWDQMMGSQTGCRLTKSNQIRI